MGDNYILFRGNEVKHTVSNKKLAKMRADGWRLLVEASGYNVSVEYRPLCRLFEHLDEKALTSALVLARLKEGTEQ
jgi:hypothetical protein